MTYLFLLFFEFLIKYIGIFFFLIILDSSSFYTIWVWGTYSLLLNYSIIWRLNGFYYLPIILYLYSSIKTYYWISFSFLYAFSFIRISMVSFFLSISPCSMITRPWHKWNLFSSIVIYILQSEQIITDKGQLLKCSVLSLSK